MKSVRAYQHTSIWGMGSGRKLFTNHGLHLNDPGKEVLSKQIVSHTICIARLKKRPPNNLKLELRSEINRYTASGKSYKQSIYQNKENSINKIWWFFMVNADLKVGNVVTTRLSSQKQKIVNFHKANQSIKSTTYFKLFHQNIRGLGKKAGEPLSHLHPDSPHVLCLTEHHLK